MRQHALYNYANKYTNLKSEMAGSFIRQLLARAANDQAIIEQDLSQTLRELFSTFFPGKEFIGPLPTPDGRLQFPVRLSNGAEHDIDELSSGEKEVLYGYLRLRNAAPKHSVLLIDEPELHLNPRLISGLASFYHRHLGMPLGTQLWLVTHSDTLIREAVGQTDFSVYHLQPPGQIDGPNQASAIRAGEDLERLVIELVGDLAAYRPNAKIVVFEGDSDCGFDVRMTTMLFPEFQARTNSIGGGSKRRVGQLYDLLEQARLSGHLPGSFYSITDADGDLSDTREVPHTFSWDVYHIENYLLEPEFILLVLKDLNLVTRQTETEGAVLECLRKCAEETVNDLVSHRLKARVNQDVVGCLDFGFNPNRKDVGRAIREALDRSKNRLETLMNDSLSNEALERKEAALRDEAARDLSDGNWIRTFRGRKILRRFVHNHGDGKGYETVRDLILARMRDREYRPPGMKRVVDAIMNAN